MPPKTPSPASRNPWLWVPSLYTAEGLPYVVVMTVSVIMYKGLGVSNADLALYTSWLYLPWVLKPLWSPVVDILRTRRWWIWTLQWLIGAGLAGVALAIPAARFFQYSLAFLALMAFSSATHDIAADGFYLLATTEKEQSFFVGIRSTFYRVATIFGQGLLVILVGWIQSRTGLPSVQLTVSSRPGTALVETFDLSSSKRFAAAEGELRVLAEPVQIEIAPQPRPKTEVAALLSTAKAWNTSHGFDGAQQPAPALDSKPETPTWWRATVSSPLGNYLKSHFGRASGAKTSAAGNIGLAQLHLSRPPGRQIVVTTSFGSGDKNVSLAEGSRLLFNDSNWDHPALLVVQLDPALKTQTSAVVEIRSGNLTLSWTLAFLALAVLFAAFGLWHQFVLPRPAVDQPGEAQDAVAFFKEFLKTFGSFFRKPRILACLSFLLLYRLGEAQLVKLVTPFLLDAREAGGLGLTTSQVGFVYGTVGIIALTLGGWFGGLVASRNGLKFWLWPMLLSIHLPDAAFIYLAAAKPDNLAIISAAVALEQFGYGFGFTAFMLYMIYIARGRHPTAHYAICTGFMALGMMLPGMWSGWLQERIGYQHFFWWVLLATIPSFMAALMIPLDAEFGRKT